MHYKRRDWSERLYDPEFRGKTYREQAEEIGVSPQTIGNWKKELTPAQFENILKISHERLAGPKLEIETALYKKAKGGDVQAIKLWKESIEGWSPKQINENFNKNEIDSLSKEEAIRRAKEIFSGKLEVVQPDAKSESV